MSYLTEPFYLSRRSKEKAKVEICLNISSEIALRMINDSIDRFPLGWHFGLPFGVKGKEFFGNVDGDSFSIYQGKVGRRYIIADPNDDDAILSGRVYSMPYGCKIEARFSVVSSYETIGVIAIFGLIALLVSSNLLDYFTSPTNDISFEMIFIATFLIIAFFASIAMHKILKSSMEQKVKSVSNFLDHLFADYKI